MSYLIRDIWVRHDARSQKSDSNTNIVRRFSFLAEKEHTSEEDNDYVETLPNSIDNCNLTTAVSQCEAEDDTNGCINNAASKKFPIVSFITLGLWCQQNLCS